MERYDRWDPQDVWTDQGEKDQQLCKKIWVLLGSPNNVYLYNCDALYFDFSVIPKNAERSRDSYLIFGITDQGEFISKWIDRWELDEEKGLVLKEG